jgi:hypothetical protein
VAKAVALLTGFVEEPRDAAGNLPTNALEKRRLNRARNELLRNDLVRLGLSYYPVIGAGQTQRKILGFSYIAPSEEESLVVQSRAAMLDDDFLQIIRRLLVQYDQYAAALRIRSDPLAFLLLPSGQRIPLGTSAEPRQPGEPYYTALIHGPRADDGMLDAWELRGERNPFRRIINWFRGRSDMNQPRQDRGGRRFVIKNPEPIPKGRASDVPAY